MLRRLLTILVGLLVALIPGTNPTAAQDSATNPSTAQAAAIIRTLGLRKLLDCC
jgi:hypothetical protein